MKALSIKQPWASLIAHGIKDIENRTWKTHFRGRIYIHSSAKDSGSLYELLNDKQIEAMSNHWTAAPPFPDRPLSAIIGEVDIIDCVMNHPSIWAEKTPFCPITGLRFFMDIEDENGKMVPTYGGPFDSYTIPFPDETCKGEYVRERFCHDSDQWQGSENVSKLKGIPKDQKPIYNWVLANPILYDKPILNVKGKLSFWDIDKKEIIKNAYGRFYNPELHHYSVSGYSDPEAYSEEEFYDMMQEINLEVGNFRCRPKILNQIFKNV